MKKSKLFRNILSLALALTMLLGVLLTAVPAKAAETGSVTFVYAGSNTNVKGSNLGFYVTWGTKTYNNYATSCGITITTDGTSATLTIDKSLITDTVWLNIWDNANHEWKGVSCTFSGETYYLYDDKTVSTEAPKVEEDEEDTNVEYATAQFTYVGSNTAVNGSNLHFYITWGTETVEKEAAACGFEVTAEGKTATLKIDKTKITSTPVYINIWEDNKWVNWNGGGYAFEGGTYYIYDDKVSTEAPKNEDEGDDEEDVEKVSTTFVYAGSSTNVTGADLQFWVTWGTSTYNNNAAACGITVTADGNTVTLTTPKTNVTDTVWLNIWEEKSGGKWEGVSSAFSGETYYIYDDKVSTVAPGSGEEEKEPAYKFTVHCYGEGYQIGAWMASVKSGKEVAWTDEGDSKTASFANPEDGWTSAELTWDLETSFNRLGFKLDTEDPWKGTEYAYDFTESPVELWVVPGYEGAYATKEEALANMWTNTFRFTVYCYDGEGYQIGAWLADVKDDVEVSWTPEKESRTSKFRYLRDHWSVTTVEWNYKKFYDRLCFKIGQKEPWESKEYSVDFPMHQTEFWIIPGDTTVYTSEAAALESLTNPSAGYDFHVYCYGEGYKLGAWLARVTNGEEVAWTDEKESVTGEFTSIGNGWSELRIRWNLDEEYNRVGIAIGTGDPWAGQRFSIDIPEKTGEIWLVPGDVTPYASQKEAEEAMTPGEEVETPVETEPAVTEAAVEETPVETEPAEQKTSGAPVAGIVGGIAAVILLLWWLLAFLRKRKIK